jgi:signal transduction histidine kinase
MPLPAQLIESLQAIDSDWALLPIDGRKRPVDPLSGEPLLAWGDADRLQQCLTNLVENALKHTPAGCPIELLISAGAAELVVHVRDHGPGVHPGDRRRIFERFVRGAPASGVPATIAVILVAMLVSSVL